MSDGQSTVYKTAFGRIGLRWRNLILPALFPLWFAEDEHFFQAGLRPGANQQAHGLRDHRARLQKYLLSEAESDWHEVPRSHFSCLSMSCPNPFLLQLTCCRFQRAPHCSAPRVPAGVSREPWPQGRNRWFRTERRYLRRAERRALSHGNALCTVHSLAVRTRSHDLRHPRVAVRSKSTLLKSKQLPHAISRQPGPIQ
jgi:hypothetical protein